MNYPEHLVIRNGECTDCGGLVPVPVAVRNARGPLFMEASYDVAADAINQHVCSQE